TKCPHAGNPTKAATTPFDVGAPAPGAKDRARHYPRRSNPTNVAAPFNVGAPSRCERPGHDMTLVGATPNEAAPRSMYEHRPRCDGPRTTPPPYEQPYHRARTVQCRSTVPVRKAGARHDPRRSNPQRGSTPFNVRAPPPVRRTGHDITAERATLPKRQPPFDVGAPAPGAKGSGTKSPRRRPISLPD